MQNQLVCKNNCTKAGNQGNILSCMLPDNISMNLAL